MNDFVRNLDRENRLAKMRLRRLDDETLKQSLYRLKEIKEIDLMQILDDKRLLAEIRDAIRAWRLGQYEQERREILRKGDRAIAKQKAWEERERVLMLIIWAIIQFFQDNKRSEVLAHRFGNSL